MASLLKQLSYIPNLLTLTRIAAIPLVLAFIRKDDPVQCAIGALIYVVVALTDFFDGYLARRSQQVSLLGQYLDPLADKILVMAVLIWMIPLGRIEPWIVIVLLTREISINALRSIASAQGMVIAARAWGKDKTAFQMLAILFLIVHVPHKFLFVPYVVDFHRVGTYLIYVSLFFSLISAADYMILFGKAHAKAEVAGGDG